MNGNLLRIGNFTSSEMVALTSLGSRDMNEAEMAEYKRENPKGRRTTIKAWPGDSALTYIEQTNMERRLHRSLDNDSNARPLVWGLLCEQYAHQVHLPAEYVMNSKETIRHEFIDFWTGSPDVTTETAVGDLKSPMTLSSFCKLVDPTINGLSGREAMDAIRFGYTDKTGFFHDKHKDGEKFFIQLVSNAILTKKDYAELIVFCPFKGELDNLRDFAANMDDPDQFKYKWINDASDSDLPYIPDAGVYSNVTIIRFEVTKEDKTSLVKYVQMAGKYLIPRKP